MSEMMLISDAAKAVNVENHVLRYWEEELHLPIKRNELGHRYYTKEDVERFKQIKSMKERGLQLKAIKMILRDGKIDVLPSDEYREEERDRTQEGTKEQERDRNQEKAGNQERNGNQEKSSNQETQDIPHMAIEIVDSDAGKAAVATVEADNMHTGTLSKEEKSKRLQWLLQQLIRETLAENNTQLCNDIKESVVKELDYQFRLKEERDEERNKQEVERSEEYYRKMDELLRGKSSGRKQQKANKELTHNTGLKADAKQQEQTLGKADSTQKKKRHFIF